MIRRTRRHPSIRPSRSRARLVVRALAGTLALLLLAAGGSLDSTSPATAATSYTPIAGTGSTWSQNALDQWRRNVATNYGMTVNYSGTGSSAGRRDFIAGSVDFAISEIPFQAKPEDGSAPEVPPRGYAYMPIVAGGTAFMYNLKIGGKRVTNLRLSGEVLTKIFTNVITKWNDPAIQADNPGLTMPDRAITPVVRSDGSGSTAQFTTWMATQHPALWSSFSGLTGLTSQYPVKGAAKAQSGSLGVSGYVSQGYGEGAITYVEYSYALKSGFPVAKMLNTAGYYVEPTAPAVAIALKNARITADLTQILDGVYAGGDPRNYPLSSYSYMIVPTEVGGIFTADKGSTLGTFASYMLCEGQQQAAALGYSPLPMNLVEAGFTQIKRVPGAGSANVDPGACNNPMQGDALANSAPQPAACDKQGPEQCTSGTGGAGGPAAGGPAAGTADTAGSSAAGGGATGTAAGEVAYDENGAVIGAAGAGGGAVSSPFTLAATGFGLPQWVMLFAVVLIVGAAALPPLLSRRLRGLDSARD